MNTAITLRPRQVATIEKVRQAIAKCAREGKPKRVLLVAPCGFGKTITSSAIMGAALDKGNNSIFMADRRILVDQKSRTLTRCGIPHSILMAGEEFSHAMVVVASKDTYWSRVVERATLPMLERKLWVVDEAHQQMGRTALTILQSGDVQVGLTATPVLPNGKGLGGYWQEMVIGATYAELLAENLLVPARVFAPWEIDTSGLSKHDGDWSWTKVEERINNRELVGDIVDTYRKLGEGRPFACFASGVPHSIALCEEFNAKGIKAKHIDADTPAEEREEAFRGLDCGELAGLCNFGVLGVGFDLPRLSCGILGFATGSLVKFLQVSGRLLRTHNSKNDCVLIDHGGNVRRHGWPTEDHSWSLDSEEAIEVRDEARREKDNKPREPICCPKCAAMRESGPVCPACGHKHTRQGAKVRTVHGEFREVKTRDVKKADTKDELQRVWMACLAIAARRSGNAHMAKAIFASKTHQAADNMRPMPQAHQMGMPVGLVYPGFVRRRRAEA